MDFADNEFDVVLDKGTFDALMSDESDKVTNVLLYTIFIPF